jgi:hypothetical protein
MAQQLIIKGTDGWKYFFRQKPNRPIEMQKRHNTLGALGNWQVARNLCLKALISQHDLLCHFNPAYRVATAYG